ncbi:unnamed protein product, partial [Vitis vinifera]|uniref:Uncharacterized protein n=1 Tax=Vitis vinifera TaxID=29760 RepID=D7TFT5_VITVI
MTPPLQHPREYPFFNIHLRENPAPHHLSMPRFRSLHVHPAPTSSSTGAGFESSTRLACYGSFAATTSRMPRMDLGFSGLDSEEKPKFVKALIALGLPNEDIRLGPKLEPRPSSCG